MWYNIIAEDIFCIFNPFFVQGEETLVFKPEMNAQAEIANQ